MMNREGCARLPTVRQILSVFLLKQSALNQLIYAIDSCLMDITLQPGEFLFVNNYRAVHGRKPFKAKYDGTDRRLKRTNITRDLGKSRSTRLSCESRIIF
jgi:alpha-ketoglutarate-dependent taurine dioxygenase